ncbi:cadherin-like domain-containing protein [Pseudomonas sp. S 311-6]|uniref:Ig-like domain-containing protein n=1 Tax=Pseudomonas TaxID=286 RepID=UPI00209791DC|nr:MULTISPECIES: Ig-like domain-containing protein [Pseudomonas]MCO7567284.1 cadherin-like domain-containing protein [Pseudomonas mosselii]MCO7618575.1 cadherin-like domain-containing protein [Pseudomonas guariconensis]MCO7638660.1 cadherin-like domain-containing protein [Pseudomonas sp. S 311-6]
MNTWPRRALCAAGLSFTLSGVAWAALSEVDPGPYTLATGRYPMWYKDSTDLSLELCQSRAISSRAPGTPAAPNYMCMLAAEPGYDDRLPMVFPDNWPSELFWFLAETEIPQVGNSGYELEVYVAGLEAAFASEVPVDGDQQSFARIRIRATIPRTGVYTITHPYGVETINVTSTGRRAINMTRDIGIGGPGNFTGALNGNLGPFLRSVDGPYTEVNPDTGATETFVGDPNITQAVTGSPFNTNFVRIEGPAGTIQTNLFTVSGKVLDARAQTPVELQRATYQRNAAGTRVELFAKAPNSASLCMRNGLELIGTPPSPCQFNLLTDNNGLFFSQQLSQAAPPAVVVVTASSSTGATRPTSLSSTLSDVVKIRTARYDWANKRLVIEASSSDEVQVPDLVAQGYGRLSKAGTLQSLTVNDLAQPPASVTVKSAAGGSDVEPVVVVGSAPVEAENQPPLAQPDSGSTSVGVPVTLNLLANDSDPDGNLPLSIADLTQPGTGLGSVVLNGSTAVTYTPPPGVTSPLVATFSYRAQDAKGLKSEPATVTVNVAPNQPPTAVPDSVATLGVPLTIDVLANDSDPEGNLPLSVASVTQPPAGRGTVSTDGSVVTYTPPGTITTPFSTSFTYVARDALGALSGSGTVTVQVSPRPAQETFTVTAASVTARSNNRFNWDISGTSSVTTGNTVTVQVTTPNGLVTLGSVAVPITGRWRLAVSNSTTVIPTANPTAIIRSSQGSERTVPVNVQ